MRAACGPSRTVGGAAICPTQVGLADFGLMRLATLRRPRGGDRPPGVLGPARMDLRTKRLTKRLRPGDIAIIDHVDLDRVAAEALVRAKVSAVVNVSPSISGRRSEERRVGKECRSRGWPDH